MLESKNENNLSYYQSMKFIKNQKGKKTVILGFDNVSRRYQYNDLSWLWDVDFELLNDKTIDTLVYAKRIELKLENDFDPQTIYSRTMTKDTIVTFDGTNEFEITTQLPENLPDDSYDVFLRISQYGNWPSDKNYSTIRFANDSTYFDNITGANLIGSFVLSKKATVISRIPQENSLQSKFNFHIQFSFLDSVRVSTSQTSSPIRRAIVQSYVDVLLCKVKLCL